MKYRTRHPDAKEIENEGDGPAIITYKNGTVHKTKNLAYTTALKYTTIEGEWYTSKGSAIRHIQWVEYEELT